MWGLRLEVIKWLVKDTQGFQVAVVVKNLPVNTGDIRDGSSILGSGRSPEAGHHNPLKYSCLENPIDRGAWWVTVHGITKSQTQLSTHFSQLGSKLEFFINNPNSHMRM